MEWIDIASIVFVCVTANHLGLVSAVEKVVGRNIPIINCAKCFTMWSVLLYLVITQNGIIQSLAISFLASYVALWLELFEGFIDTLFLKLYEKIETTNPTDTATADAKCGDSASTMPKLR